MARVVNDLFVLFLIVVVPVMSYLTARQDELLMLPRKSLYFSAVVSQWSLAILAAVIIVFTSAPFWGFNIASWGGSIRWTAGLIGASFAGIGLGLLLEAMGWWPGEAPLVARLIPVTHSEKVWALLVVAPTAGICEEFVYRGYLLPQLARSSHSVAFAWAVSSIAFGLCHAYQRFSGVVRATLLGALLAAPIVFGASIYPAIVTHILIDAAALLWIGPASLKKQVDSGSRRVDSL
ncbi:MAG: CPBP family intramembrane glutamic endopeptidase [Terriglobia bacterium]